MRPPPRTQYTRNACVVSPRPYRAGIELNTAAVHACPIHCVATKRTRHGLFDNLAVTQTSRQCRGHIWCRSAVRVFLLEFKSKRLRETAPRLHRRHSLASSGEEPRLNGEVDKNKGKVERVFLACRGPCDEGATGRGSDEGGTGARAVRPGRKISAARETACTWKVVSPREPSARRLRCATSCTCALRKAHGKTRNGQICTVRCTFARAECGGELRVGQSNKAQALRLKAGLQVRMHFLGNKCELHPAYRDSQRLGVLCMAFLACQTKLFLSAIHQQQDALCNLHTHGFCRRPISKRNVLENRCSIHAFTYLEIWTESESS